MIDRIKSSGLGFVPLFSRECTTVLKGTAIVLVIIGHRGLIDCAGSWGVLIFLMLSGYGIFKSAQKKGLKNFWCNRVIGVLVPYMLFSVIQLGLSLVKGEEIGVWSVFCMLMGMDFGFNLDPTMWFISYIFVCYAVFCVAWHFFQRRGAISFVLVMFVSFVLIAAVGLTNIVWHRGAAAWAYFWAFPAGVLLAMYEQRLAGGSLGYFTLVGLSALVMVTLMYGTQHESLNLFSYSAAGAVFMVLAVKFLMDGPLAGVLAKALQPVGDVSYAMYLNEGFLIRLDGCVPFVMGPVLR